MKKILIIISILTLFLIFYDANYHKYKAPQKGDTSKWQVNLSKNKAYELALDYQGRPIFKNPKIAFKQLNKR